jgi:hypothetical protein
MSLNVLILDDSSEHGSEVWWPMSCIIIDITKTIPTVVKKIGEADLALTKNDFTHIIIHHYDFTKIDALRSKFPDIKYAGYSANIDYDYQIEYNTGHKFFEEMRKHYDYLISSDNFKEDIISIFKP